MRHVIFLFCSYWSYSLALDNTWWKHTTIYEIIPYTFKDSDGDGVGDLQGIISKLDYLADLGIQTIELTPMWETPFYDFGYDVADYYKISPQLGTMDDFDELVKELSKRGMKLMLDLVINHSSNKNEWFLKSIDRIEPYTNYYIWADAKGYDESTQTYIPPNRWVGFFTAFIKGSAWEWNEKRKQFYFHQFTAYQPDFNLRNDAVKDEVKKIFTFWMNKGVAGFRLDAVLAFFEDKDLRDDTEDSQTIVSDMYEYIHELRLFVDEYSRTRGDFERILVPEAHGPQEYALTYYDREDYVITQFPYYYQLQHVARYINAVYFNQIIEPWLNSLPKGASTAWMTGDHDSSRIGSRIGPEYNDIFTITSMMLPGTAGCYYGQEISMLDGYSQPGQMKDYSGSGDRDPNRMIMQWDDSINAGFSTNTTSTFEPANPDYYYRNVEVQKKQKISHYHVFKDVIALRKTDTLKFGDIKTYVPSRFIYIFTRSYKNQMFVIVVNFSSKVERVKLKEIVENLPSRISVVVASVNSIQQKGFQYISEHSDALIMRPMSCMVFKKDS